MRTREPRLPVSLWIPAELLTAADKVAEERDMSRSRYIRMLMLNDVQRFQSQQVAT